MPVQSDFYQWTRQFLIRLTLSMESWSELKNSKRSQLIIKIIKRTNNNFFIKSVEND